jgi:hypothetical protein
MGMLAAYFRMLGTELSWSHLRDDLAYQNNKKKPEITSRFCGG